MSEWISVKERLPPPGYLVLVSTGWTHSVAGIGSLNYETADGGEWDAQVIDMRRGVISLPLHFHGTPTHWMPLPESPK